MGVILAVGGMDFRRVGCGGDIFSFAVFGQKCCEQGREERERLFASSIEGLYTNIYIPLP